MFKVLAIALLVVASSARFMDTKTVLAQMDKDKFGNTMLSAVALNMAIKAPQEDVLVLIDQILDNLEYQQNEADKANVTNQADCDETISSLNSQIFETSSAISQLETAIADNEEILSQARRDLSQANDDYDEVVKLIAEGTA